MATEEIKNRLKDLDNVGKLLRATRKGDWSPKKKRAIIGMVMDEVSILDGDTRYEMQRICTNYTGLGGFQRGVTIIRYCYHTIESRIRAGSKEFRIAFGQFAPLLKPAINAELQAKAHQKWGACGMPFEDC